MSPMTKSDKGNRPPSPVPIEVSEQQRKAMLTVDSSSNPTITPIGKITYSWNDTVLERDKGIWTDWAYQMKLALSMTGLWELSEGSRRAWYYASTISGTCTRLL
ncbi:hypothetical protein H0H92_001237, partial [Tricholoma furcatifolium]